MQEELYLTFNNSPLVCTLHIASIDAGATSFQRFVGESSRTYTDYPIKCLWDRNFSPYQREKYGISEDVTGAVYLSPKMVKKKLGYWKLDKLKTKISFNGENFIVDELNFLGEMYNSCIAIELRLVSDVKGG